ARECVAARARRHAPVPQANRARPRRSAAPAREGKTAGTQAAKAWRGQPLLLKSQVEVSSAPGPQPGLLGGIGLLALKVLLNLVHKRVAFPQRQVPIEVLFERPH